MLKRKLLIELGSIRKKERKEKKNCLLNDRRIEFLSHYLLTCSASLIFNGEEVKFDDG
jgi:hypothetical protein